MQVATSLAGVIAATQRAEKSQLGIRILTLKWEIGLGLWLGLRSSEEILCTQIPFVSMNESLLKVSF